MTLIILKELQTKACLLFKPAKDNYLFYKKDLVLYLSPVISKINRAYQFFVLIVSKSFHLISFILRAATKLVFWTYSSANSLVRYLHRKIYVWKILSVKRKWYQHKSGGFYNPKMKATIFPSWECTWNLSRANDVYKGFDSKESAQDIAFKMWMKKRRLRNRLGINEIQINIPLPASQKIIPNKISIRKLNPKDVNDLLTFMGEVGCPLIDEQMKSRIQAYSYGTNNQILIAERKKKIVGFIAFVIYDLFACEGKRCHIEEFLVIGNPPDLSIKRKLMQAVEDYARENNGKLIDITFGAYRMNDPTNDFYKFLGYGYDNTPVNMHLRKEL